ncbi:fibronectin type III domain-containing protein [Enterococcus quebecensis]|uniref:Serine protease n=2 Tax=Enterococcus quebecensis TaxID=903983 RepID=A0A1E5H3D1_9ENTE|nr:fibronectin type III domain-containing protein [Enterococcus quebecensis]OEG19413.1 hypothetical protein BCR23_01625 [Enterococcus quebecensis]
MKIKKIATLLLCGVVLSTTIMTTTSYAEERKPESRAVIGTDERVRIMDTTKAPYSSVAYLSTNQGFGSSTVIGKNKILTAGHVVENIKTSVDISQAKVYPARNGNMMPYGSFDIESVDIHKYWSIGKNRDFDIAVVTVKPNSRGQNIGDVVPIIPVREFPTISPGTKGSIPGYSQDKHGELWEGKGSVLSQTVHRLFYDIDAINGTSGSPVFNEQNQLIAVHTSEIWIGGVPVKNSGSKITRSNYEFIAEHLDQKETDTQAPSQVTGLKATNVTKNSAQLSWNPSTDNVGVDKYEVYRNGTRIGESKTTNYAVNGLTADTSYTFTVVAVDKAGNRSQMSSGVTIRTEKESVTQAPSQVTGLKATNVTKNSAQLSWNPSTANVGIDRYEVYRNGVRIGESKTTNYAVNGLTADTSYTFTIVAVDKAANRSQMSAGLAVRTEKEVDKPVEGQTTWVQSKVYVGGDKVFYKGIEYKAKWWTQGNTPGTNDVWEKLNTEIIEEWNSNLAYTGKSVVTYKGIQYQAKWWTRGEEPGKSPVWEKI